MPAEMPKMPDLAIKKRSVTVDRQKELSPMRKNISIFNMAKMSRENSDRLLVEQAAEPTTPVITPQNDGGERFNAARGNNILSIIN